MKVFYIAGFTGPEFVKKYCGGIEKHTAATQKIKTISHALLLKGYDVTIISSGVTSNHSINKSFTEYIVFPEGRVKVLYPLLVGYSGFGRFNFKQVIRILKKELKKSKRSTILAYNATIRSHWAFETGQNFSATNILELEDLPYARVSVANKRKNRKSEEIFNKVVGSASGIIYVSDHMKVPRHHNGITIHGILSEDILKKQYDVSNRKKNIFVITYTGGLDYSKGIDILIESLKFIPDNCLLNIVGGGHLVSEIKELCKNNNKIRFHGFVERNKMLDIMFDSDILVNPHRSDDNLKEMVFPFKMVEYASTGIPLVSSGMARFRNQFDSHITFYNDDSPQSLANSIISVTEHIDAYRLKAGILKNMINEAYSLKGVSEKLHSFFKKTVY